MLALLSQMFQGWGLGDTLSAYCAALTVFVAILVISWLVNVVLKHHIVRFARLLVAKSNTRWGAELNRQKVFRRLSHLGPGLVIYEAVPLVGSKTLPLTGFIHAVETIALVYMLLAVIWFLMALLDAFSHYYHSLELARRRPMRGYVQLVKIILWFLTIIFAISIILGKSPLVFLTGLGAISAVLMLVFKDTILGLLASVQVSAYDMVRVGDWIVLPSMGANGDVVEVNINTVKVQNFDKTMVTMPTYALISNGMQNWRGMTESGGRRIKRSIHIDIATIKICDEALLEKLHKLIFLKDYIERKSQEIAQHNHEHQLDTATCGNGRALTNVGLYRTYIENYLKQRPDINLGLTFLVRHLDPTPTGLPIQLYVFTNDTNWTRYEAIQADIFDHLLAILPTFELSAFQNDTVRLNLSQSGDTKTQLSL